MKKEELNRELQIIVERIHLNGWEKGKEQCKTPYKFTLTNDKWLEEQFSEIINLFAKLPDEKVVLEKLFDKYIEYNSKEGGNGEEIYWSELHIYNNDIDDLINNIYSLAIKGNS